MEQRKHAIEAVAAYFSVLSDPTRIRIMHALCDEEKTVSRIVREIDASQTNVSRHLGIMYRSGVLARRKEGNQVYYRAADADMVELCRAVCRRISDRMYLEAPVRQELMRLMPKASPAARGVPRPARRGGRRGGGAQPTRRTAAGR